MANPNFESVSSLSFEALLKGKDLQVITLKFMHSNQWKPESNRNYMILGGTVNHVTGTASELYLLSKYTDGQNIEYVAVIPAATASIYTPLFTALSGLGAWHPIVIPAGSDMSLYFTGDATAYVKVTLLVW